MESLKRNLELVKIKNLQEIYQLNKSLFGKRKEISTIIRESNQESLIEKITPYIKEECIVCTNLINNTNNEESDSSKINALYDFFNEFNDIFGSKQLSSLLSKVGFIQNHIKEMIESLNNVSDFRKHLNIEEISQWNSKDYQKSVIAHKEVSEKQVVIEEDFFKPLVSYFLNDLSKDKKAEFLLKLDLFKKSGWAEYIIKEGYKDEHPEIVKLNKIFEEASQSKNKNLDIKKQQEFKSIFEKFFDSIEVGINISEKGLNIASISNKNTGLYNLASSGMPDGSVKGCPHNGRSDILYVGWATANTKKYAQNLQWFRHLEGIEFSIKMKKRGFEEFNKVDGSIVSLAISHDEENIGFIKNELKDEEKSAFQILGEITEVCKGLSVQNGRYKSLAEKISSISLIGSQTEISMIGKSSKEIEDNLFKIVKLVNETLKTNLETSNLSKSNKVKREIYLTDFSNAISYLSEIKKQNVEFKEFLKNEVSPTFLGLAQEYPEMSNNLMKSLSFSLMNAEGIMFDVINKIEDKAQKGFEKDYMQRGFHYFNEKVSDLKQYNKNIDSFTKDVFSEIKKPLYKIISESNGYQKLDKLKENALWHMLKVENLPNKGITAYEKEIKDTVSKFKNKKTANKCIEFFKEIQKGFPHFTLLSSVEDLNSNKKERLTVLTNITQIYEKNFGELETSNKSHKSTKDTLIKIETMTKNALKDIDVLEEKNKRDINKEIENFIDELIKEKKIDKNLIEEEIDKFDFIIDIKDVFKEIIKNKKLNNHIKNC